MIIQIEGLKMFMDRTHEGRENWIQATIDPSHPVAIDTIESDLPLGVAIDTKENAHLHDLIRVTIESTIATGIILPNPTEDLQQGATHTKENIGGKDTTCIGHRRFLVVVTMGILDKNPWAECLDYQNGNQQTRINLLRKNFLIELSI
jgi:hypothetical protein